MNVCPTPSVAILIEVLLLRLSAIMEHEHWGCYARDMFLSRFLLHSAKLLAKVMFLPGPRRLPCSQFLLGILLGFLVASLLRPLAAPCAPSTHQPLLSELPHEDPQTSTTSSSDDQQESLLFVGVMTAQKFLDSRAKAVYETWGQTVPGRIMFFSSEGTQSRTLPVLGLPGVDDSYPPQKKSFLMFKYMHDHLLDKYEWFMRADDDVYVRMDQLGAMLRTVNSSKPQFLGQAGTGNKEELGQLSLERDDNFCMGGPGMILSRETLRHFAPHIRHCLKNLLSTHEDVEVGRCIKRFVNIPCTWSYEMQSIFYHSFSGEGMFEGRLKKRNIQRAVTMHPIKSPPRMYRLHSHFLGQLTQDLRHKSNQVHQQIYEAMKHLQGEPLPAIQSPFFLGNTSILGLSPSLTKDFPQTSEDEAYLQQAFNDTVLEIMETVNKFSKQRGRTIDFQTILYGYMRLNPLYGVDYILDLLLTYRKYRGKKMTVPVRRHAYLQQAFSQPEVREVFGGGSQYATVGIPAPGGPAPTQGPSTEINFVLPLSGRLATFQRFLKNFEQVCLIPQERVSLAVVLVGGEESDAIKKTFEDFQRRYPHYALRLVEESRGTFSRALALEIGANLFPHDALLAFIDVDIIMSDRDVLQRIRLNTLKGRQAYFPVVFSEYDPKYVLGNERVYWRQFGYGIASLYHADLRAAGGFDRSIEGWGKEDVDLFSKVVRSNLTAFRAPDPGLIHIFHPIHCSPNLPPTQLEMCRGSRLSSLASTRDLAKQLLPQLQP
ncbi:CHSY1 [Cordylochernes scorpioides]|uniref:Hexosyltransferase n=1 Tax=Cordylochernes scorpioides TaxID=51811 RepID=A0ABY6K4L3_9ARAC|nr:CHSY1 [Cordylochernes scorpioides]